MSFENCSKKAIKLTNILYEHHDKLEYPRELLLAQQLRYTNIVGTELPLISTHKQTTPYFSTGDLFYHVTKLLIKNGHENYVADDDISAQLKSNMSSAKAFHKWYLKKCHHMSGFKISELRDRIYMDAIMKELNKSNGVLFEDLWDLLYNNNFLSHDISNRAETNPLTVSKWKNDNVDLIIYHHDPILDELPNLINKLVLYVRGYGDSSKLPGPVKIVIYLNDQKKRLDDSVDGYLTPYHINSGSCYPGKYIYIWRKEELPKVLIHELIHYFGYDISSVSAKYMGMIDWYRQRYNLNGRVAPNEALTESIALIMHTGYISTESSISVERIWHHEQLHSAIQLAKFAIFISSGSVEQLLSGTKQINQTTGAFSYYVMKAGLLWDVDKLNHLIGNVSVDHLKEAFATFPASLIRMVDHAISALKTINKDKYGYYNLRMSAFQLIKI